MKLTSPFAPQAAPAEAAEHDQAAEQGPSASQPAAAVARPRRTRTLLDLLEQWLPGVGSAQLPSIATVRAYHRAREYVPWEAGALHILACLYGWLAVCWVTVCTLAAWAGAGDYRRRLRTLWRVGLPGLVQAQLPPLRDLAGPRLVWVAAWSVIAWTGLKFTRPITTLAYLLGTFLPLF